jgi:hypothetical protein
MIASVMTEILTLAIIPVVLAVLGLTWPSVLARHRGRRFHGLILRELEETAPWPLEPSGRSADGSEFRGPWWTRQQKNFVHREIFADPSGNKDFILSLDPTLVYLVTQLWDSLERHDGDQWLWYLHEIATDYDHNGKLWEPYERWRALIESQGPRI